MCFGAGSGFKIGKLRFHFAQLRLCFGFQGFGLYCAAFHSGVIKVFHFLQNRAHFFHQGFFLGFKIFIFTHGTFLFSGKQQAVEFPAHSISI